MVGGGDRWVVVLEDFLSVQVLAAVGSGRCSDQRIHPSVSCSPLLYYLTLFKHYMAQQRVDRAISYPPELLFLLRIRNQQLVLKSEHQC